MAWLLFPVLILILSKNASGLICYRCDSYNHGTSCHSLPATRHLRDFGDEEPCLSYEDVNTQYLALQKALDSEWYYSPVNGDHGLPVHLLVDSDSPSGRGDPSLTLIHADRDLACLFVRSTFHHNLEDPQAPSDPQNPPRQIYFRKCVQLPTLDVYPICRQSPIYKGHIELCLCRTDKCNYSLLENPHPVYKNAQTPSAPGVPPAPPPPEIMLQGPQERALVVAKKSGSGHPKKSSIFYLPFILILYLAK